jgi:hypothetical protein
MRDKSLSSILSAEAGVDGSHVVGSIFNSMLDHNEGWKPWKKGSVGTLKIPD